MRIVVVGGGMAGVTIAAELSTRHEVTLLEMENQLAYHTSGRSAAMYLASYGNDVVRNLTAASLDAFHRISRDAGRDVLTPRPLLTIFGHDDVGCVAGELEANPGTVALTADEQRVIAPYLDLDVVEAATLDNSGFDIDVSAVHQAYLVRLKENGGRVTTAAEVHEVRTGADFTVVTERESIEADLVVNAAGAWGDVVADRAGCERVGLVPKRRTIATSRLARAIDPGPIILGYPEEFYFRVDTGSILLSPADETPSEPCDARPEEMDIALAIEAVNTVTNLDIRSIDSKWAGLRTFAVDKSPVVGSRKGEDGFFWFCGQGGYGIQMAPGLASLAADIINGEVAGTDADTVTAMSPDRF